MQNASEAPALERVSIPREAGHDLFEIVQDFVEARLYAAVEAAGFDMEEDTESETYDHLSMSSLVSEAAHDGCTLLVEDIADWLDGSVAAFARRWTEQRG